ncbi:MAG: MopE-related protein [Myxococcota bacterium]
MRPLAAALLAACFSREEVDEDSGGPVADTDEPTTADTDDEDTDTPPDDTAPEDTGDPWWETGDDTGEPPDEPDVDEDGWSEADGDCDDLDEDVHPDQADVCDGEDEDCDGEVDEDFDGDAWEPNDRAAVYLGEATDEEPVLVSGYVFGEDDADGFSVYVYDSSWSWFSLEAWLYGVPEDADYALQIVWAEDADGLYQGTVAVADDAGEGGSEVADWGGYAGEDNSGVYEIWVTSSGGATCETAYTLEILVGGW